MAAAAPDMSRVWSLHAKRHLGELCSCSEKEEKRILRGVLAQIVG